MNREKDMANYAMVFFVAVSVFLLIFPSTGIVHTARIFASYSLYPSLYYGAKSEYYIRNVPKNFVGILQADQENRTLKQRVRELELAVINAETLKNENERLSQELKISKHFPWKGVWARVINKNPGDWYGSFFIDKGSGYGIRVNDTVIGISGDKPGLAGRVFEVYPSFSKVILITNNISSVVCAVNKKGMEALAEGRSSDMLTMNYIPENSGIVEGEELYTSYGGLLFPQGILVGRIAKIHPKESFMNFITADIVPAVDGPGLKEVFVISRQLPDDFYDVRESEKK